jgi:hypothetical protein
VSTPEKIREQALASCSTGDLVEEVLRRKLAGDRLLDYLPGRQVYEIRGVIDAAEIVQAMYRNGELAHLGLATASGRERYASGVQEALRWVLGEEPWADLERLIEEED